MAKVSVTREKIKSAPKDLKIGEENFAKIGDIVKASILRNIRDQQQVDGSRIKTNEESTRHKKELAGRQQLSLVDEEHRFTKPANWKVTATKEDVTVEPKGELVDLVRYVQEKPRGKGGGYTGWFGVNKKAINLIRGILVEVIDKAFGK